MARWSSGSCFRRIAGSFRRSYRQYNKPFFVVILVTTIMAVCLSFFFPNSFRLLGIKIFVFIGFVLLFIDMLGLELSAPHHPQEILQDVQRADRRIDASIQTARVEILRDIQQGKPPNKKEVEDKISDIMDDYHRAFRYSFTRHIFRYYISDLAFLLALCACATRILILAYPGTHYDFDLLSPASSFVDHLYFATVTIVTIGYGKIAPISFGARVLCLFECLMAVFLVTVVLNNILVREGKRETRFFETIQRDLFSLAGY